MGAATAAAANAQVLTAEEAVASTRRALQTDVARHWTQIQSRVGRVGTRAELVESTRQVRAILTHFGFIYSHRISKRHRP